MIDRLISNREKIFKFYTPILFIVILIVIIVILILPITVNQNVQLKYSSNNSYYFTLKQSALFFSLKQKILIIKDSKKEYIIVNKYYITKGSHSLSVRFFSPNAILKDFQKNNDKLNCLICYKIQFYKILFK